MNECRETITFGKCGPPSENATCRSREQESSASTLPHTATLFPLLGSSRDEPERFHFSAVYLESYRSKLYKKGLIREAVMKVLGFTGLPGSGKGTLIHLIEVLTSESCARFVYLSMSDVLRQLANERFGKFDRDTLNVLGNELRSRVGNGALAMALLPKIKSILRDVGQDRGFIVVDSIRTPEEVTTLREALSDDFLLVGVTADRGTIVERIKARARFDESPTAMANVSGALELLEREDGAGQPGHGLNISGAIRLADVLVDNSGTTEQLRVVAKKLMSIMHGVHPDD